MRFETRIVTDIGSLCDAVNQKYGWKMDDYDLCQLLFGEDYNNDYYKSYYFDSELHPNYYSSTDDVNTENKVREFLREMFPGEQRILIDVSW